jgi:predicted N-formylglutamate amidohydrolase
MRLRVVSSDLGQPDADPEEEPMPHHLIAGAATTPLLLVCDHASNRIPAALAGLGLPAEQLTRHIAWDIGAAWVCRRLSARLSATAVLSGVSRLVIDCNRAPGDPTSIPDDSDGVLVPGNLRLDRTAKVRRAAYLHDYHYAIANQLHRLERGGKVAAVVSIHSFTPVMDGVARPWHVGVLWNRDPRLAVPLLEGLRARDGLTVGDNQPYSGRYGGNYTTDTHGAAHGRPHVAVEIRQDLLADPAGCHHWADVLAEILPPILARPDCRHRQAF